MEQEVEIRLKVVTLQDVKQLQKTGFDLSIQSYKDDVILKS